MIRSFRCKQTQVFFHDGLCAPQWRSIEKVAARKLDMLDAAIRIDVLRFPPGNHLEKLRDDREGQWSIRINDQWRVCFRWSESGPEDVEIVDYH